MSSQESKIILERLYSRNVLGKAMGLVVVGCIGSIAVIPDFIVPVLSFYGFLLIFLLSTFFYLTPERTNIILSVNEIRFREGVWFNRKPMVISWDDINEVNFKNKKLGIEHDGVEQECFELHLKEKGTPKEDKPHRIEFSSGPKAKLGRRVKHSSKNLKAENAVQLIRRLMDANSNEVRTKLLEECGEEVDPLKDGSKQSYNNVKLKLKGSIAYEIKSDKPYSGNAVKFRSNGQKEEEANYKDGKLDGLETQWYPNGQKMQQLDHKDGKLDGLVVTWYESGQKEEEANYKDDKQNGLYEEWHENGQKMTEIFYKDDEEVEGSEKYWNSKGESVDTIEEAEAK